MGMKIEKAKKLDQFLCSDCSSDNDAKRPSNSFPVSPSSNAKLWQAFVGVNSRHIEKYYQNLLDPKTNNNSSMEHQDLQTDKASNTTGESVCIPEKWKGQIEKVIT